MSSDHHGLSSADAGRHARDVRRAIDRVLEDVRTSVDGTLRRLVHTIASDARAADLRFSDAMRRMDDAPSLRGVLHVLTEAVGRESDRHALLIASQGRLRGWSVSGFNHSVADAKAIDLPADPGGLLGAAIRAKSMIWSTAASAGAPGSERPQFAQGVGSRDAVAVPVVLGGTVAGVLYADALSSGDEPSWTHAVDRLVRYAALVLETRTARYLTTADPHLSLAAVTGGHSGSRGGAR